MLNSIHLNPFAISNLLIILTCFPLAGILFVYGKTKASKVYCLHLIAVSLWGLAAFITSTSSDPHLAYLWSIIAYCGVVFIPIFFLHSVFLLIGNFSKPLFLFSYLQGLLFLILNFKGVLFKTVKFMFNSFYFGQGGILFFISFLIWIFLVAVSFHLLIEFYRKNKPQVLLLLIAEIIGFGGGGMNFLLALNINLYPVGNFLIPLYIIILTYGVLKYQVFEVIIVIRKSFVYSALVALITSVYLIFVLLAEKLFQGMVGYTSLFISILYAFVIALFFTPAKNKLQHIADKIFLGKDPIQIAKENELMKEELERSERLKAVAHFASGMAHEIKNPLTAIKTFSEYLPQKQNDPEFLSKFSKIVSGEVSRIDSLVHQLLEFSKPSPLKLEDVDIHKLLDETLDLLSNDFLKHSIRAEKSYTLPTTCYLLKADSNRMKQAFLNLFLNSIDAMPSGGTLTVSTLVHSPHSTDKAVDHRPSTIDHQYLEIVITDTGSGISSKDLPHIFEPFYSTKDEGTGLGLSIVFNIVKEHNGAIRVESKIGEGTKFIIELPINYCEK